MTLFAGSCQRENLEPDQTNGKVTFTVEVPAELQTKAIADGKNVDQLIYEVWLTKNKAQKDLSKDATKLYQVNDAELKSDPNDNNIRKVTIELDLMNDQNFTILFWAQVNKADPAYITDNLTGVTYAKALDEYDSNDESLAAFYSSAYIVDGKHVDAMGKQIDSKVTLRRPFAQLNLGNDNPTPKYTINVLKSDVKVTSVPTVFNVATKETSEPQEISFQIADIPNDPKTLTVQDKPYDYVAMNYVFAGGDNVAVEYNIYTKIKGVNGEIDATVNNVVKNVPLKENYRTNIVGNLLTSKVDYQIVVDANFNQPDIDLESLTDGLVLVNPNMDPNAASYTKMYEISSGNGFAFAMMYLVPAMESGESAEFYLLNSIDMEGINYVPSAVPSGVMVHLGIGAAPITRSTSGIVITGLDSPIFAKVENGGTASFSNIVIENLSDDTNAALVGENDGKVVISNCEASNDQNNEVDLIGDVDNNGTTYDATEVGDIETLKDVLKTGIPQVVISKQLKVTDNTVLDLNGTSISAIDSNETGSYAMFEVQPDATLTVNGPGSITLTATTDRQWSAYSSVISNQRGKLVVNEGVVIEHLGGTSMAYAIDNLTNTGEQDAVTIVNGATVKSKYRAIRQFLNSPTGSNELYVKKGSTVLGDNKAIWPQDANSNANPGILEVEAGAEINDVYLSAANATKQWPLQISIPSSAFVEGGEIVLGTIPTGYEVKNIDGIWGIFFNPVKIGDKGYATIADALVDAKDGDVITIDGSAILPTSLKTSTPGTLTIQSESDAIAEVSFDSMPGVADGGLNCYADGMNLIFKNIKVVSPGTGSAYSGGFGRANSVKFEDSIYEGQYRAGNSPTQFINCTIDPKTSYIYTDYVNVDFIKCTFNCSEGKGIQVYNDGNNSNTVINVIDCSFIANKQGTTWDGKPVTAIDANSNGEEFTININNSTDKGFPAGQFTGETLFNIKGGAEFITINVDGKKWTANGYEDAEGNLHVYTVAALKAAIKEKNARIFIYPNIETNDGSYDLESKMSLAEGVSLIGAGTDQVVIKNSWSSNLFANQAYFRNTTMENIYNDNNLSIDMAYAVGVVTFKNCTFGGSSTAHQGVHFDGEDGTIVFDECDFIGRNMFAASLEKVTFNNCEFINKRSTLEGSDKWTGVNMWGTYEFNNCVFGSEAHCNVKCDGVVADFNNCSYGNGADITTIIHNSNNYSATIKFDGK